MTKNDKPTNKPPRRTPPTPAQLLRAATNQRRHKYRAKPTTVDGIRFASKKEARRYAELKLLERAGRIENLRRQVRFKLVQTVVYVADFTYDESGESIVEDVKGFKTPTYKQKRRLMQDQHGITIREV